MLISFSGPMASGKDTLAGKLEELLTDKPVYKLSFAKALKDYVTELIYTYHRNVDRSDEFTKEEWSHIEDLLKKTTLFDTGYTRTSTVRELLQYIGTDVYRQKDPDKWVNIVAEQVKDSVNNHYIITDARFKNEINWVKDNGGFPFILDIDNEIRKRRMVYRDGFIPKESHNQHISENDFKDANGIHIDVNGSIDESMKQILEVLSGEL